MKSLLLIFILLLSACSSTPAAVPEPTTSPTARPSPTRPPWERRETSSALAIMHMAGTLLSVDIGVHPHAGWPAVVAVESALTTKAPSHVFVRVYNPDSHRWASTQSLGSAGTALFSRFRTAQIAITPDNTIHVVWGPGRKPWLGLYASESHDYGETWSAPKTIAQDSYGVFDIATALDGSLFVLANSQSAGHPLLIKRDNQGQWLAPELLPIPSWYGSTGALHVAGTGLQTQITLLTTGGGGSSADNTLFSAQRLGKQPWSVERHSMSSLKPELLRNVQALALPDGVMFTAAMVNHGNVYTLTFRNAQRQPILSVMPGQGKATPYATAAFDSLEQRSIVLWTCCADATFVAAESTHYARWKASDNDVWQPGEASSLVTGARSASASASAQAAGSRQVWLVWAESVHDVMVRSLDLDLIR